MSGIAFRFRAAFYSSFVLVLALIVPLGTAGRSGF